MKKKLLVFIIVGLVLMGGVSTYYFLSVNHTPEYKQGVFVDRGTEHGYAKMYSLY